MWPWPDDEIQHINIELHDDVENGIAASPRISAAMQHSTCVRVVRELGNAAREQSTNLKAL